MKQRPHIVCDHIEIDGERYVLLDATPEQVLRWLHKHHRMEAFASIRRAAAVARQADRDCAATRCMGHGCPHADDASIVRRAIRVAIGSDKA